MASTQALTDIVEMKKLQQFFEQEALKRFKQIKGEIDEVLVPTLASWQDPVGKDFQTKYQTRVEKIQDDMQNLINPLTIYLENQARLLEGQYLDTNF